MRATAAAVLSTLVLAAAACGKDEGPPPPPSAVSTADPGVTLTGTAGGAVAAPVRVRVTAADGRTVRGASVSWAAGQGGQAAPVTSTTDADGIATTTWTLGSVAGPQTLGVTVGGVPVRTQLTATAAPGRVAVVRLAGDSAIGMVPGLTVQLAAQVADRFGNVVAGAPVAWRSDDSTVVTVDATGRLIARAPGVALIEASSDTARARVTVRVSAQSSLSIARVAPDTLRPGGEVTVEGAGFVGAGTELLVAGIRATTIEVTPTRIRATIPSLRALPCQAADAGVVTVRRDLGTGIVDSARRPVILPVATRRSLRVGESVALLTADAARCTQLDGSGRYIVSVFNTDESGDRFAFGQLRGVPLVPAAAAAATAPAAASAAIRRAVQPATAAERRELDVARLHAERLEWERELVRRVGSPLPALRASRRRGEIGGPRVIGRARRPLRALAPGAAPSAAAGAAATVAVGDTVSLNVYNLASRSCARAIPVRARVVHVGPHSVVYEDVANAQAGTLDATYRQVGEEFDATMFPILERNFGNPVAMDSALDADGRIGMIFTKVINDSMPNVLGFVTSCNYFPRSDPNFAASNEMELFYARAPQGESPAVWRYNLRATTIHEVKHITAFGEKIARAAGDIPNYEDGWLEESSARLAEELFARTFSRATWRGNAGFAATVGCELTRCDDRPRTMEKHWGTLHLFYRNVGQLSPFAGSNDFNATYYASGWSLLRWALDHYAGEDEAAFLRALTLEPQLWGVANLAARTGRPPAEMLADWGLAMFVDDAPGVTPLRSQLSLPSWNGRDVLRGLSTFNPAAYPGAFPLAVRTLPFGDFLGPDLLLRGWSTAFHELAGSASAPQLLELRAPGGGPAGATLRMAIVRVE